MTNNQAVFRRLTALGLVLGLQSVAWAGVGAHAHVAAHASGHHGQRVVHAHAAPHAAPTAAHDAHSSGVDLHTPEGGSVVALDPFVAVETSGTADLAPAVALLTLGAPDQLGGKRPVAADGGHDPPALGRRSPRAPPLA